MNILKTIIAKSKLTKKDYYNLDHNGFIVIEKSDYMLKNLEKLKKKSADLIKQEKDKGGWEG